MAAPGPPPEFRGRATKFGYPNLTSSHSHEIRVRQRLATRECACRSPQKASFAADGRFRGHASKLHFAAGISWQRATKLRARASGDAIRIYSRIRWSLTYYPRICETRYGGTSHEIPDAGLMSASAVIRIYTRIWWSAQ